MQLFEDDWVLPTVLGASVDTTVVVKPLSIVVVFVTKAVEAGRVCVAYEVMVFPGRVLVTTTVCGAPATW